MIAESLIKSEVEVERCVVYMKGGIITLALGWVCVCVGVVVLLLLLPHCQRAKTRIDSCKNKVN